MNSPSVFYGMAESETRTSVLPAETVASRPDSQATSTGVVILDGNTRSALAHGKLRGTEMFGHSKRLDSPWQVALPVQSLRPNQPRRLPGLSGLGRLARVADDSCALWKGGGLQRVQVPPGNWFAPPGSNRSSGGGNEAVEAFDVKGRDGDSASVQAVT